MEGLSDEEVAEITGLRPGTVRVRLHRARLFVRKELVRPRKRPGGTRVETVASRAVAGAEPRPARCKAMFAELSNYLLEGCDPCQAFLAGLEATIQECRRMPSPVPDRAKAVKLRKEVMGRYERALRKLSH